MNHDPKFSIATEAERGLLGCLLQEPQLIRAVSQRIGLESFSDYRNMVVISALEHMAANNILIDLNTVTFFLAEHGKLEKAGGAVYLTNLLTTAPTPQACTHFIETVCRCAAQRQIAALAEQLKSSTTNADLDLATIAHNTTAQLNEIVSRAGGKPRDGLPEIMEATSWLDNQVIKPPELITGLLHRGSKLVLGGSSKSFKTWALLDMAVSVAAGAPWWGNLTNATRVLYLNFEIQEAFFHSRLFSLCQRRNVTLPTDALHIWNLRGHATDFSKLLPLITARIEGKDFGLVMLDPVYRGLGDRDENKAGDVAALLNEVEKLAVQTGAAVAFAAHFSKGKQSGKEHADRMSGSGVFARDPDTIITLTRHQEPDHFSVEVTLRNFAPMAPFVVGWNWPLFERADGLDPTALKSAGRPKNKTPSLDEYLAIFPDLWPRTPREALLNWADIRQAFTTAHWNRDVEPQLRAEAISAGRLAEYRGRCNSRLVGKPNAIQSYEDEQHKP